MKLGLTRNEDLMARLIIAGTIMTTLTWLLTGCGTLDMPSPMGEGRILISADEKGMRAFGDTMVGIANESRTPAGIKSSHYQLREVHEAEETKRRLAPGFFSRLLGGRGQQ